MKGTQLTKITFAKLIGIPCKPKSAKCVSRPQKGYTVAYGKPPSLNMYLSMVDRYRNKYPFSKNNDKLDMIFIFNLYIEIV